MTRRRTRKVRDVAEAQQQYINRVVSKSSYRDVALDESINLLTSEQIEELVEARFGVVKTGLMLQFEKGEVISSSRGDGSLQRMKEE